MKKKICLTIALLFYAIGGFAQDYELSPTRYDWSNIASQITQGTADNYQKAYKIYRWICDNISYDTGLTINTADACFDSKKGVCQGYSELYCRIAEGAGIKAEVITGLAKDMHGNIDSRGHAWVFAVVDGNAGILIDPTWGSGTVTEGRFEHSIGDDSWFHIDPNWAIFTHFPTNPNRQFIDNTITEAQFRAIPYYNPSISEFGINGKETLQLCLAGKTPDFPKFFDYNQQAFQVAQAPTTRELRIGKSYTFAIKPKQQVEPAVFGAAVRHDSWQKQGEYLVCNFVPQKEGELHFCHKVGEKFQTIADYQVATPTAAEIATLEAQNPKASPAWEGVKNYNPTILEAHGVNLGSLLGVVKSEGIKTLPIVYNQDKFIINSIPWNGVLQVGSTYTFAITPQCGIDWAVITKPESSQAEWFKDWQTDPQSGIRTITITPSAAGKLIISVKRDAASNYWSCIEYMVR